MHEADNPNLQILMLAVDKLGDLIDEMVFVGGCATGLLINKEGAPPVRITYDVDAIVQVVTLSEYYAFAQKLRQQGFKEDSSEGAPICRFVADNIILDVMPSDESILGFGNNWYTPSIEYAQNYKLPNGKQVKMLSAAYFLMTKFEAFSGRGKGDYLASHDLEDILSVIDGRSGLVDEISKAEQNVKTEISKRFKVLLSDDKFIDAIPGHLPSDSLSQSRIALILSVMKDISNL